MNAEMKANRIVFGRIKQQYDLMLLRGAHILAEQQLIDEADAAHERDTAFMRSFDNKSRREVKDEYDAYRTVDEEKRLRSLRAQLKQLEHLNASMLAEEKYEEMQEIKELIAKITKEIKDIDNDRI